jgi:twitching motility protein PilT
MSIDVSHITMEDLLQLCVDEGASDIHLSVGAPPVLRINGSLHPLDCGELRADDTKRLMLEITPKEHMERIEILKGADYGLAFKGLARFRVSVLHQQGSIGMVLRQIPSRLIPLDQIGLPPAIIELLNKPRGLILVTGPTGSGKTSTLASMIDLINREHDCHIITIEDPVEYQHGHKKSIITQREIGVDVPSFAEALRAALRQDPDVILVGEMRDLETISAAITAAETGHLVLGTLHTTGAAETIDRIIDAFPSSQQAQVRSQLADSIQAVISQLLLPRIDRPGRVATFEIMVSTPGIKALIRDHKTFRIKSDIQTGSSRGMIDMEAHLVDLYNRGIISYESAVNAAPDRNLLDQKLGRS